MKLYEENKKKKMDIEYEDDILKECLNSVISIISLPVLVSDIQGLYENNDDKLLDALAHDDKNACYEFQQDFITVNKYL